MESRSLIELAISFIQMFVAIGLFVHALEPHKRTSIKTTSIILDLMFLAIWWAILDIVLTSSGAFTSSEPILGNIFLGSIFFLGFPILIALFTSTFTTADVWPAFYCTAVGYTLQNLTSSSADIIELVIGAGDTAAVPFFETLVLEIGFTVLLYPLAWVLIARPLKKHGLAHESDSSTLILLGVVFLAVIIFDLANKQLADLSTELSLVILLKIVHLVVCAFVLYMSQELLINRHLREETLAAQNLLAAEKHHYELSRENIEAINIKCHDIRHQIRHLGNSNEATINAKALNDIAEQINIYDNMLQTGNDALDTILSEKSLLCEREEISLRCIADGHALDFMAPTDIYALFGNALDNAIEASYKIEDTDKRSISLVVRQAAGVVSIHVENYYDGHVELGENGLPSTTKTDTYNHGFGTRSIQLCVDRYGGTLAMRTLNNVFHLNITIPIAQE